MWLRLLHRKLFMDFLRKNLFQKYILFALLLFVMTFGGMFIALQFFGRSSLWFTIAGGLGAFAVLSIVWYFLFFHQPLHKILREMKALLAGKRYHRVYTEHLDEWGVLANFFNEVTKNIERISIAVKEGERMSSELTIASDIQKMVLPITLPQVPGLDIFASTRPAVEIGGDNYDVIRSRNNAFIYVGDVTGHGVPAGLVMIMANTLIDTFTEMYQSAYDVVVQTNRMLKPRIQTTMFMTMVMLRFQELEKKMYYIGCGHEHVLTFQKKTGKCEARQSGGIALGMVPDNSRIVKEEILPFDEGDFILLYSDGIVEAKNTNGEQFGLKRLKEAMEKFTPVSHTAQELFTHITTEFSNFVEDQIQGDDITLMAIRHL